VDLLSVLPLVWLTGALGLGGHLSLRNLRVWRAVKRERLVTDQDITELLENCKMQMGIETVLAVAVTDKVKSPALFGFVRPRLLLPQGLLEMLSLDDLRHCFLHELAHVKRRDIYIGWWAALLEVVNWFNPLIWFAFRQMRADQEMAADAMVLSRLKPNEPPQYGRTIVSLLERFSQPQYLPSVAGFLEDKLRLERRIAMITQFKKNSDHWSSLAVISVILLACISLPNARCSNSADAAARESATVGETPSGGARQQGPILRELNIDMIFNTTFSLSRDGSKIVYWKLKDGRRNLVVRNLISGEDTEITHHPAGNTWTPVFSPDGDRVVYTWEGGGTPHSLHTVSPQTGEVHCLNVSAFPMDWSRDGRFILLSTARKVRDCILCLDGDTVEKVDLPIPEESSGWRFSPDNKYVSYSHDGNLYLYHLGDNKVTQITTGSNDDTQPLWSPNGTYLIFLSRRGFGSQPDLCYVAIADGRAVGDVHAIRPDLGDDVELYSLSARGQLLYRRNLKDRSVLVTKMDPQTGPIGEPVQLAAGSHPIWSPDGRRIAYIVKKALHVMSADGTDDQEVISVNFPESGTYAWSPDGDQIYIQEFRTDGTETCAISISTKERRIVLAEDPSMHAQHLTCSPDGKRLAFLKPGPPSGRYQVFTVDVDGTNLRQLTFYEDGYVWYPAWSPDGKHIAVEYGPGSGRKTLSLISVDDGTTREVFRGETSQERFCRKSWSPDGSKIAWVQRNIGCLVIGHVSECRFDTFSVKAGDSIVWTCCWSPDGTKMLLGTASDIRQLMIMENFLPEEVVSADR